MKRLVLIAGLAIFFSACHTEKTNTSSNMAKAPLYYQPAAGDAMYSNGDLYVWRNNQWVEVEDDVGFRNGVTVYPDGRVVKDGKTLQLDDDQKVDQSGNIFDKAGNLLKDAWQGVKKGAGEVKEEAKDVFGNG
jgi:hypothetical protein